MARVALLEARPMRCHRCLERGHTRATCPGEVDRSGRCYRCGEADHTSRGCRSAPKCPLCTDKGRPATHVLGANTCTQRNVRGRPPGAQGKASTTGPPPAEVQPVVGEKGGSSGGTGETPKPQRQPRQEAREGGAPVEAPSDGGDKAQ
ncbi:PREDICTED: DNA-binding protein HEXBP-like [Vollenhovia emeryi]|uniref:DNA-binding protein HEXBP-like n=1 Tax=Vollenhovia emeryi TaxID=411798 RepID=UPI0005F4F401|nr:PREDICTED: DNA-binding protein HEXBP-like [Vollenhovia emeryi]